MTAPAQPVFRFRILLALTLVSLCCWFSLHAQDLPECSLSKTNKSCQLVIDRSNPVAPSTVQMYSDQQLTVVVKNPLPFERYFLDFTTGQAALTPDVTSTIVQTIIPELNHLSIFTSRAAHAVPTKGCDDSHLAQLTGWPKSGGMSAAMPVFDDCFAALAKEAIQTYRELEPLVAPDSLTENPPVKEPNYYQNGRCKILADINGYVSSEAIVSTKITYIPKDTGIAYRAADQDLLTQLAGFQKLTDAIAADLLGYRQRLADLGASGFDEGSYGGIDITGTCSWSSQATYIVGSQALYNDVNYISKTANHGNAAPDQNTTDWQQMSGSSDAIFEGTYNPTSKSYTPGNQVAYLGTNWLCVSDECNGHAPSDTDSRWIQIPGAPNIRITSRRDAQHIYQNMVTRSITYSLDALNLVSYSQEAVPSATNKKALATVAINFADQPNRQWLPGWPPSALRLEASAGVFFSWMPNRTFTVTPSGTVQDSKTRPTPVPFAAANYRLTNDFGGRWKQNIYLTGAVGINPNNTTTDFGVGVSYAWRAFMISPLCHIGHDVKISPTWSPTSGSTTAPTTTPQWGKEIALGISVRVPSLTGR